MNRSVSFWLFVLNVAMAIANLFFAVAMHSYFNLIVFAFNAVVAVDVCRILRGMKKS